MAKKSYKIPHGINVSQLDIPISLRQGSLGLKRPITLRIFLIILTSIVGLVVIGNWLLGKEFGLVSIGMVLGGLVFLIALSIIPQKNRSMGYKWFLPTVTYWLNFKERYIITRSSSGGKEVAKLKWSIPVERWDEGTGIIYYTDGSYGVIYDIIGYGSRSLFDEDRDRVIDAYDGFLRQISVGNGVTIIPRQISQDVTRQIDNLKRLRSEADNVEVDEIIARQLYALEMHVAKHFRTTSIRMELRSQTMEQLQNDVELLANQHSMGMFRKAEPIRGQELVEELRIRYSLS